MSLLAATDSTGFFAWDHVDWIFTRRKFHEVFKAKILPHLNPWPLPRSIVILDNATIHMYRELQDMIHSACALLYVLPPYSPQRNSIELQFSLLKRWTQHHVSAAFRADPLAVIDVALKACTTPHNALNAYTHCGYSDNELRIN